jgi:LysM repeat protein
MGSHSSDQNIRPGPLRHILQFSPVSWWCGGISIHRIGMLRTLGIALVCLVALAPSRVEAEAPVVVVQQGDALSLIAQRAGVSVEQIKAWNDLNGRPDATSRRRHRLVAAVRLWSSGRRGSGRALSTHRRA